MNRSEKAAIIEQIRSRAAAASIAVVTDFKGMSVEELTRLRVALRNAGGEEQRHGCREREIAYRGNDGLALCGNVFYQQGEGNAREEHGWVEHIIESLG